MGIKIFGERCPMRQVMNPQFKLGELPIVDIKIDLKSRDDIPQLLLGLQYIYTNLELRSQVFSILEEVLTPGTDRNNGRPVMDQWKILKNKLDSYISRFDNKNVAIWGAGHQALAIMSLLELGDKIRYVVDSAPFKQGKFTPATHISIVPPARMFEEAVHAIIVMAASYSDEVVRIIRQQYKMDIPIAVLRTNGLEIC